MKEKVKIPLEIYRAMHAYVLYPRAALKKWYTKIPSVNLGLMFLQE